MMNIRYIWNRLGKKLHGKAIAGSKLDAMTKVEAGSQVVYSSMGKYSYCGYDCKIISCDIGAYCSIADGVIIGGARHPMEWASMSPMFYAGKDSIKKKFAEFERPSVKKTKIGNDVWIGDRAMIKAGVTIGNGAVIGMGSIVTKDVGRYEIWAGNPAKKIRDRFPEEMKDELEQSRWWDLDDEIMIQAGKEIRDPRGFLDKIRSLEDGR